MIPHAQEYLDSLSLDRYIATIDEKVLRAGGRDWTCLSEPERLTITAYFFALEVCNGGIAQFFINPAGDHWRDTLVALKLMGPEGLTRIFEEALTVFPSGVPSDDQLTRSEQYQNAGAWAHELLESLTIRYYDLQAESAENCLYAKLGQYARKQLEIVQLPRPD